MRQSLSNFVLDWNKSYEKFKFSYDETPVTKRPTRVEVRFSANEYENTYSHNAFSKLQDLVIKNSHDTMYIVTDRNLLRRGIIEIKIASEDTDYREAYVVDALESLGKEFLSHKIQAKAG